MREYIELLKESKSKLELYYNHTDYYTDDLEKAIDIIESEIKHLCKLTNKLERKEVK